MLVFFVDGVATRDVKYANPLKLAIQDALTQQGEATPLFYSCFLGNALSDVKRMWNWIDQDLRSLQHEDSSIDISDRFRSRTFREGCLSEFVGDMLTYLHPQRGFEICKAIAQPLWQFLKDNPQETDSYIAVAILFRTFLWTRGARPQKCPRPNRSGGCYIIAHSLGTVILSETV